MHDSDQMRQISEFEEEKGESIYGSNGRIKKLVNERKASYSQLQNQENLNRTSTQNNYLASSQINHKAQGQMHQKLIHAKFLRKHKLKPGSMTSRLPD